MRYEWVQFEADGNKNPDLAITQNVLIETGLSLTELKGTVGLGEGMCSNSSSFVDLLAGFHKNHGTDFHVSWLEVAPQPRIELLNVWH